MDASDIGAIVDRHVRDVEAIDVHTHLLPPTHGTLMLYGIDELLTYHYLVAELFMVLPIASEEDSVAVGEVPPSPDEFHAWSKARQAELVFEELFVARTPLSEACRGVITVLTQLGLQGMLREAAKHASRPRLTALRGWFAQQDPAAHLERVFSLAKLKYAVMTNIPFAQDEAIHWTASPPPELTPRLRTALRVDPVLAGDWSGICAVLSRASPPYELSLDGCTRYLKWWVKKIRPVYLMASTPAAFSYTPTKSHPTRKRPACTDEPHADGTQADSESGPPSPAVLLEQVLLRVAREEKLAVALKIGAVRGANPALRAGGDGVEVADLSWLRTLCVHHPSVKFLVTVLSADNQHELCVLARKFGNLHVYVCHRFGPNSAFHSPPLTLPPPPAHPSHSQVWLLVVLQQPVDYRGDDADAAGDARLCVHLPALRRASPRPTRLQMEALARRNRPRACSPVRQAHRVGVGSDGGRRAEGRAAALWRRVRGVPRQVIACACDPRDRHLP